MSVGESYGEEARVLGTSSGVAAEGKRHRAPPVRLQASKPTDTPPGSAKRNLEGSSEY